VPDAEKKVLAVGLNDHAAFAAHKSYQKVCHRKLGIRMQMNLRFLDEEGTASRSAKSLDKDWERLPNPETYVSEIRPATRIGILEPKLENPRRLGYSPQRQESNAPNLLKPAIDAPQEFAASTPATNAVFDQSGDDAFADGIRDIRNTSVKLIPPCWLRTERTHTSKSPQRVRQVIHRLVRQQPAPSMSQIRAAAMRWLRSDERQKAVTRKAEIRAACSALHLPSHRKLVGSTGSATTSNLDRLGVRGGHPQTS